ncbi:MAG: DUF1015 family protein [Elusimicrobia bacterium]|nr:DUF1015 family protein [Elusimicrobiota bacterium]
MKDHKADFMFGAVFNEGGRRRAFLAQPRERRLSRRFPTGLGIEWVSNALLIGFGPKRVSYTHDAREAWRSARGRVISVFIKSITVKEVCRAVQKAGLLPQKSTYFYPKVGGGIVFKPAEFSGRNRRSA